MFADPVPLSVPLRMGPILILQVCAAAAYQLLVGHLQVWAAAAYQLLVGQLLVGSGALNNCAAALLYY